MPIAAEELAQLQRPGRVTRAHQNDVALTALDKLEATQYESPHKDLAQLGILGDEQSQAIPTQFKKFARLGDAAAHKTASSGDHTDLARELSGTVRGYRPLACKVRLDDFHASGEQNEKWDVGVTGLKQDFASRNLSQFGGRADATDLRRSQNWESLSSGVECARNWCRRHFSP